MRALALIVRKIYRYLPFRCETGTPDRLAQAGLSTAAPRVSRAAVRLPVSTEPLVSVVIAVCGNIGHILDCLLSMHREPPKTPFEVIVVDDGSPDGLAEPLKNVQGIRLVRNPVRLGYGRACNAGVSVARGDYLCFLDNGSEVTAGWLDELLRTFQEFPGTGLAGSKVTYLDGRLREAGGIIRRDGSALSCGRFQDALLPAYNFAREVDFCSRACIMVAKSLFIELRGFDGRFLPAPGAEADLAHRIRDKGHRVVYQPLSAVVYRADISSGTDAPQDAIASRIESTCRLQDRLEAQPVAVGDPAHARDRTVKRRVLVLEHCTLTPDQDSGSVMVLNLLLLLREMNFQVTFIPVDDFLYVPGYTAGLQRVGIEVLHAPYVTSVEQHLTQSGERYDLAFLFRPGVFTPHYETVHRYCPNAKVLYHTVDLHFLRFQREATVMNDEAKMLQAAEMKQREFAAMRVSDASIVLSTAELELLRPELPGEKIHVFPYIGGVRGTVKPYSERRDIVFVGGYKHPPNVDAVQFFVLQVMPYLRHRLPGVRFHAAGSNPPAEIQVLASEDVIIAGFVEELNPFLDRMRVSVAPVRYGAGIKGKIGAAIAGGLPVVATPIAAEGMSLTDGENILVADGAEAIASSVARLYADEALWNRLSVAGRDFAREAWSAEMAWGTLAHILGGMGIVPESPLNKLSLYTERENSPRGHGGEEGLAQPQRVKGA